MRRFAYSDKQLPGNAPRGNRNQNQTGLPVAGGLEGGRWAGMVSGWCLADGWLVVAGDWLAAGPLGGVSCWLRYVVTWMSICAAYE